jgi:YtkA-like
MSHQPAHFKPASQTYTTNHAFLVRLVSLPDPIPYEKHFTLSFSVHDSKHTDQKLSDATVHVTAGMRHGMKTGFAHGMQSSPQVENNNGIVTVSGLYFHMMGKWTLQVDVQNGAKKGTAYLDLPCCVQ